MQTLASGGMIAHFCPQTGQMRPVAIADNSLFALDSRELQRETPSYTAETFRQLREEQGETRPLAFIIGQDSLLSLPYWYRYEQLLERCHLLVCRRPGYPVRMQNEEQQRWLEARLTRDIALLHQRPAGQIFLADTPLFDISATDIRHRLAANRPCDEIVPPRVLAYIREHHLYR